MLKKLFPAKFARADRYSKPFRTIKEVVLRAFHRRAKIVEQIRQEDVNMVAQAMEASLIMVEDCPPETRIQLDFSAEELSSFVAYMQRLDYEYRELAERFNKLPKGGIA